MINYYQPLLLPFLGLDRHDPPPHIRRYYYHSFEDGLWDFLEMQKNKNKIIEGSVILVPDFYCMDVINNITQHGYVCEMYPVDEHFQVDETTLLQKVKKTKARIVMIFHACGLTVSALRTSLFEKLPEEVIVIEDSVHRLVNPSGIRLLDDRHIIMDSIRKVSPLPGSFMYGSPILLDKPQTSRWFTWYVLVSMVYFIAFRFIFTMAMALRVPAWVAWAHNSLLQTHDDLIGDSMHGHRGLPFVPFVYDHINFVKAARTKVNQVRAYEEVLLPLIRSHKDTLYQIHIDEEDYGNLRVYPLGFRTPPDERLIEYLHEHDIIVWFGFPDAPWCKGRSVLFLPLGYHISQKDIGYIAETLERYFIS